MLMMILFILGFLFGATLMWLYVKKVHELLESLDEKYERLINIIATWQKKV
jgi:hypothetical protein